MLSQAEQIDVVAEIGLLEDRLNEPAANFFSAILPFGAKLQIVIPERFGQLVETQFCTAEARAGHSGWLRATSWRRSLTGCGQPLFAPPNLTTHTPEKLQM